MKELHKRMERVKALNKICPHVQHDRLMLGMGRVVIDVIGLDKKINPSDGTSLAQELTNRYGKEFANEVKNLL